MKQSITPKIKRIFLENWGLKLLAVLFSIVLWLVVVNVDDPTQTKTFTTNVTVVNAEVLTDAGRYYEIPEGGSTVSFRVTARRSVMERLTGADFTATADMNYLEDDSRVPVTITVNNNNSGITVSAKRLYLQVKIGNKMTIKHDVDVETTGNPAEGCVVDKAEATPANISVSGPEDIISTIARVVAYVDIDGANEDSDTTATLHFLDKSGNEIDQSRLEIDREMVRVHIDISNLKTVPIKVETTGTLPDGVYLDSVTVDPETVQITGEADVLNEITEITINGSALDLSKITANMTTTVDLNTYLPSGVKIADSNQTQATVKVTVSGDETKTYRVPTANLTIRNLADGSKATFETTTVDVKITGKASDLAELAADAITGSVDASGLGEGSHAVSVNLDLDSGFTATATTTNIVITTE